ncbi:MAG: hypothetical protein M3Z37_08015 [Candidatus Eremiobacteraeota bacterium]|nr:hypothetical protein [Candidatus Eremiobacteraeota bacterium]
MSAVFENSPDLPRLFVTANGPGEVMGWVRPFLRAIYHQQPAANVTVVLVPCTYATGHEAEMLRRLFPQAEVIDRESYAQFLLGKSVPALQRSEGALQYLGGDLFHAVMIARRLGLAAMTYKFTKRSYARIFERFFALDEANAQTLRANAAPPDRVRTVGNLVFDAVMQSLPAPPPAPGVGDGVCIMPGSRPYEVRYLTPFFIAAACQLKRLRPSTDVRFVVSAYTSDAELQLGIEGGGDPKFFGRAGRFDRSANEIDVDGMRFPIERSGDYGALARSQLVITIPGTKCVEAAILGRPVLVVIPLNRLDPIAMNGLGAYLHLIPLIGRPLKNWLARTVAKRFRFLAQPNIDAGRLVTPEMRGILKPIAVAQEANELLERPDDMRRIGSELAALYEEHAGAAGRMALEALAITNRTRAHSLSV